MLRDAQVLGRQLSAQTVIAGTLRHATAGVLAAVCPR